MLTKGKQILKVLVGSQAHGLAGPDSDFDYRGVFVTPTEEFLKLGGKPHSVNWEEGLEDNTQWEIGHFLHLATKSNPSVLEVFVSPLVEVTDEGIAMQLLFPHIWNSKNVRDAFLGYSKNQRKKFFENHEGRTWKYAVAYIRVLLLGIELLEEGTMTVELEGENKRKLLEIKNEEWSKGQTTDWAEELMEKLESAYQDNPKKETDLEMVNDFLLNTRLNHFKYEGTKLF